MKFKASYRNFEEMIIFLLDEAKKRSISLEEFLTILSGKGRILLLILLSLGFAFIPAIAVAFGLLITYLGLRIACGKNFIWLPKSIREKKIPSVFLTRIFKQILKRLKFMKFWSKPRYQWATQKKITQILNGIMIALVGLCLASCPPVPLVGILASCAIFLIGFGLLNDDGIYIILGYITTLFYLVLVLFLLKYCSLKDMIHLVTRIFHINHS